MGPFNGKSHFLYLQHFVRALLDRGHEVTFLTSQTMSQLNLANYSEVLVDPPFDVHSLCENIHLLQIVTIFKLSIFSSTGKFSEIFD